MFCHVTLINNSSFIEMIINSQFQRTISIPMVLILLIFVSGCVSMAPVNSAFESARTLEKGEFEFMGNYSSYYLRGEDENDEKVTEKVNNDYGFRFGFGISNKMDLKLRYERLLPVLQEDKDELNGLNYFAIAPRYGFIKDKLTGGLDVGVYTYTYKEDGSSDQSFFLSPKFMYTYPVNEKFDLTLYTKLDIFLSDGFTLWGLTANCGISSDLSKWALRPEIGMMLDVSDSSNIYFTWGAGLLFNFRPGKKEAIQ